MADDPFVKLHFAPDHGMAFILDSMEAVEELGRPFLITLDLSSAKPKGDLSVLLGGSATVTLNYPRKPARYFNGIVARAMYRGLTGGAYRYRIELRPWIWLLAHEQDCRIFQNESPWAIMTKLFRKAGFVDFADSRQNGAGDQVREYCVQYRETTLDFVTRLMEEYGLYYFATHDNGKHVIHFADDPGSHTAVDPIPYRYDEADWRAAPDHVWDFLVDAQVLPGATTLRDYNFTTPRADLTSKSLIEGGHTHGSSEVYDYPGNYEDSAQGRKAARIRMLEVASRRQVFGGTSNSRTLATGVKFKLEKFPDPSAEEEYLLIGSTITIQRAETRSFKEGDEIIDTFRCVLRAVPATRPFRLEPVTKHPLIRGPQTARVAGESGQEVTTDKYGRIKVKFPWDRSEKEDENSSCWIRVAQVWAGQAWGAMFIPRIGQEVVVEFLEGDPDRPLVTGRVYNAETTVPYPLPDNKTRSTIKSNSSQGGGGFNELRFEDKKDNEEVFFHAQKDYNRVVLNNETIKVKKDSTTTIQEGSRALTVQQGNDAHEVTQGNQSIKVGQGNQIVTISTGDQTTHVTAGTSTLEAGQKILLKVGGNSIEITQQGITIKGVQVKVTADTTLEMTGVTSKLVGTADLALNSSAHAALKAAIVEIN